MLCISALWPTQVRVMGRSHKKLLTSSMKHYKNSIRGGNITAPQVSKHHNRPRDRKECARRVRKVRLENWRKSLAFDGCLLSWVAELARPRRHQHGRWWDGKVTIWWLARWSDLTLNLKRVILKYKRRLFLAVFNNTRFSSHVSTSNFVRVRQLKLIQ